MLEGSKMFGKGEKRVINNFELMHEDDIVLKLDYDELGIEILNNSKLPFSLREKEVLDRADVLNWVSYRVFFSKRTYMDKLYIARKVGRDQQKVLADSSAISIIDNFWIKRPDTKRNWKQIQVLRDMNKDLMEVVLEGKISTRLLVEKFEDMTSLYTVKGMFPKMIYAGRLFKKGFNAEYEVIGYEIAKSLGIKVAEAEYVSNDIVSCVLFTNIDVSMCHISDLLYLTNYDFNGNPCQAIYEYVVENGELSLKKDLERLYTLAYITSNLDLVNNSENFGLLYDPKTFNFTEVAPAYDFNNAFYVPDEEYGIGYFDEWILNNLPVFIENNRDILDKIPETLKVVEDFKHLTNNQKDCVSYRLNNILNLER